MTSSGTLQNIKPSAGASNRHSALVYVLLPTLVACGRFGYDPNPLAEAQVGNRSDQTTGASANDDAGLSEKDTEDDAPISTDAAVATAPDMADADAAVSPGTGGGMSPADSGTPSDVGTTPVPVTWQSSPVAYVSGAGASAVLADGLHYLGGATDYFGNTRFQHHYVFAGGTWSTAPADVPDTDTWGARAHVYAGKLYLLGGFPGGNRLRVYDPGTNGWTALKAPPVKFLWGFASGVIGGGLYAFGGEPLSATNADGYKYEIATNTWTKVASIPENKGRGALSSEVVGTRLYVLNGNQDDNTSIVQIYDSSTNTWSRGTSLQGHVFEAAAVVAIGTDLHFFGGAADQDLVDTSSAPATLSNSVNIYDTVNDSWTRGKAMNVFQMWASASVFEGRVHVLGGLDPSSKALSLHEVRGP